MFVHFSNWIIVAACTFVLVEHSGENLLLPLRLKIKAWIVDRNQPWRDFKWCNYKPVSGQRQRGRLQGGGRQRHQQYEFWKLW